jgi:hypothetical protein
LEGDEPEARPVRSEQALKYSVGLVTRPAPEPETEELPEAYGTGRLFLAARDSRCLYAHWDLTMEQQRRHNAASADHRLILRVFIAGRGPAPATELAVHPDSRHWFVHLDSPGALCTAELGYYLSENVWRTVATSEPVRVPAEQSAIEAAVRFMVFEPNVAPTQTLTAQPQPPAGSRPGLATNAPQHRPEGGSCEVPAVTQPLDSTRAIYGAVPIRHPAEFHFLASAPVPALTPARERILAELLSGVRRQEGGPSSIEVAERLRLQAAPGGEGPMRLALPASVSAPAGIAIFSPATGPGEAPFSPAGGELPRVSGFWFNVNAELVIYGATEPDATVRIGGRPIPLRPDGTFSYRFALPDGNYHLPVAAESVGGETREADLQFARETQYRGDVGAHPQDPALKKPTLENVA